MSEMNLETSKMLISDLREAVGNLQQKLAASEKLSEERRAMLEKHEHCQYRDGEFYCRQCAVPKEFGHATDIDCAIARLVKP